MMGGSGGAGGRHANMNGRPVYHVEKPSTVIDPFTAPLREIYEILLESHKCPVKLRDACPYKVWGEGAKCRDIYHPQTGGVSIQGEGVSASQGMSASRGGIGQTPLLEHYRIRSISRRYASYWNAFLFFKAFYTGWEGGAEWKGGGATPT